MGYIDQNLMPGESVVYRTRLHKVVYVVPLSVVAVMLVPVIILFILDLSPLAVVPVVIAFAVGLILLERFIAFRTSEFVVTNQRVMMKVGWLRQTSAEVLLSKVEALGVDQSFIGRKFDYGSIVITGTGGSKQVFRTIQSPLEFRRETQTLIAAS